MVVGLVVFFLCLGIWGIAIYAMVKGFPKDEI